MTLPTFVCGYEILAVLGHGTTGIVYKARHSIVKPDRLVALKMPSLGSAPETSVRLARYHNEWNALRVLTWDPDPAVPTLYDVGCDAAGQSHHYAREFVDGNTLEQVVVAGAVDLHEGIRILSTIAGAVHRIHGRWIVHRNLRPSSVLVISDGTPKLIGFGHVAPLAGVEGLPPDMSGVSAEIDVRALQELLTWLYATMRKPVPAPLEAIRQPGSVPGPGRFAEVLVSYLQAG